MPDFWSVYGLNALDIWDLEVNDFFAMTIQIDNMRREAKKS